MLTGKRRPTPSRSRSQASISPCRAIRLAPLLLLASCQSAVLDPRGPVGIAEKAILIDSLAIMLAIVVPTIAAMLGIAWWFRAANTRARRYPNWAYSGQLELIVWGIPLLTIMLLGGVAWVGSHALDPAKPLASTAPTLNIQVVSLDWKWLFIYPDQGIASVNLLVIPVGRPVHFALTSASVMNSFFIPRLGSMIYTMNGMTTQLNLSADAPGAYRGLSSHFSGDGFSDMHFDVRAVSLDAFASWIALTRTRGTALTTESYTSLAKPSIAVQPYTYGGVDADLFSRIAIQALPPGPGLAAAGND